MSVIAPERPATVADDPLPPPRPEVRAKVQDLLSGTPAFHQLPPDKQRQVASDTAKIADALVGRGVPGASSVASQAMAGGVDQWESDRAAVDAIGQDPFSADALREGAAVAGEFLKQVNFVDFVSGLIDGVFNSIVTSNIQQMEAYSKMVSDVSKSLNQFRDDNTTPEDGQDNLCDAFPDVFDIGIDSFGGGTAPKLKLKDGIDQDAALTQVQQSLGQHSNAPIESIDVSDPEVANTLILASRQQIATSRQQLLATMVLMGLSRIVVTNGKIQAKIMYDFNASSQRQLSRTAKAMDYARDAAGNLQMAESSTETTSTGPYSGPYAYSAAPSGTPYQLGAPAATSYAAGNQPYSGNYDADYYTKGKYKYSEKPVMTAVSMASDSQSDAISAKASLMGAVEVNFKSDYLPLDKMATPEMMAAIQMRSKPIDHNKPQYIPGPAQAAPAPAAQPAPTPAPAPAPAPARA